MGPADEEKQVHVGFTGTKKGLMFPQLAALHTTMARLFGEGFRTLHHGDCVGGDAEAHRVWREHPGGLVHLHPPLDTTGRAFCDFDLTEEPRDFLVRNHDIAVATSVLVAAPRRTVEERRSGTWATVRYARQCGSRVLLVMPNGEVVEEPATAKQLSLVP